MLHRFCMLILIVRPGQSGSIQQAVRHKLLWSAEYYESFPPIYACSEGGHYRLCRKPFRVEIDVTCKNPDPVIEIRHTDLPSEQMYGKSFNNPLSSSPFSVITDLHWRPGPYAASKAALNGMSLSSPENALSHQHSPKLLLMQWLLKSRNLG